MRIINGVIIDEKERRGSVKALGAEGDGTQDETAAIQAAINRYPIVHFPPGVYLCNGLVIPANRTLIAEEGAILQLDFPGSPAAASQAITIVGSNITFRNLTIRGLDNRWAAFIDLDGGDLSDICFDRCEFVNLQCGVRVRSPMISGRTLRRLHIENCSFKNFTSRAIDFLVSINGAGQAYSLEDINIKDNFFEDIAPNTSGKNSESGNFDGAIYVGGLTAVRRFSLCDNKVYRAAPQFLAMSFTSNPRVDFMVRGNVIKQEGTQVVINMSYTFNNVDNLIFADNTCDWADYEHCFLRNCKNVRVSGCHFSRANVGIAIHDRTPAERTYGVVLGCTFEDIECPTDENNGNKGVFLTSDVAEVDFVGCRFIKRNGSKAQVGIELNYFTSNAAPGPRWGMQVSNCQFDGVTGIVARSGGSIGYPGHARVVNCSFKKCMVGVNFTFAVGNVVAYCTFEDCNIDVWGRLDVNGLRCLHNLHRNTNAAGLANNGAYVVSVGNGRSIWQIEGATFRNVKNMHVLEAGSFLAGQRMLVWANHDIDVASTGPPPVHAAVVPAL